VDESLKNETIAQFETRKADHIRVAMDPKVQSLGSGFDSLAFVHEALPEIDFQDVSIASQIFTGTVHERSHSSPFFISSMTAGHSGSGSINEKLARAAELKGWAMGVGSQRRELSDSTAALEWKRIRAVCPTVSFYGNIGLSQLIGTDTASVQRLVDALSATAMIIHLNPLQEALQIEGTPRFRGGLKAIEKLVSELSCPVIVKETGCGISSMTAKCLAEVGVHAIDVAGRGGTHWGRVEGERAQLGLDSARSALLSTAADTLRDWGISTVESIEQVARAFKSAVGSSSVFSREPEIWASGGIRSGLDGAKAMALGARAVGIAQPLMAAVMKGEEALRHEMDRFDYELKTVLFCVGARDLDELKSRGVLVCANKGGAL
jgi:isopentenyl-diphosphate delta-isomerase